MELIFFYYVCHKIFYTIFKKNELLVFVIYGIIGGNEEALFYEI